MGYKGGKTRNLGITNLTRLDIPTKYGEYKINKIIFIPPVVSYARHIIGVSTLENELTITYHFMNQQEIEKEREFFEQGIRNLIS